MPIDFPNSPTLNEIYTYSGKTWIWNGTSWQSQTSTTASSATNLAGGAAGTIPYQSASGTTSMLSAGTSGQILRSNGTSEPSWEAQGLFSSGRLTLESGVAVSTTDQSVKTTMYYTPYNGDKISLYDGTNWATYTFSQISQPLGTLSPTTNYDIFLYNNSGTLTLEFTAWLNDSTRNTALVLTNGVYLKSGALTRRYLGTFRTVNSTNTEDSNLKRLLWNYNNRVSRMLYRQWISSTWTYNVTNTYRYLGGNPGNSFAFVNGIQEDNIFIVAAAGSAGSGIQRQLAIGFNAEWTATLVGNSSSQYEATAVQAEVSNETYQAFANRIPAIGSHVVYAIELQNSTTTVNYFGGAESGMSANWRC